MSEVDDRTSSFYLQVQETGKLRSLSHAGRWSDAVLGILGLSLDRGTKKRLAAALPPVLASALNRIFVLVHFRDSGMSRQEFLNQISRGSGNTDADFARFPTIAVLSALKGMIEPELNERISQTLSPEVRLLWQQA